MNKLLVLGVIALAFTAQAKSAKLPKLNACSATRLVEMRNTVLATHLLCSQVVTDTDYNWFIRANLERIKEANKLAIERFMKHDGSRVMFDKLDSLTMNQVALQASKNPNFCREVAYPFRALIVAMPIDQLLAEQTLIPVDRCH